MALLLAGSCSPAALEASNYDQSCTEDADCVAVLAGDLCGCGTPASVNRGAQSDIEADAQVLRATCPPNLPWILEDCFFDDLVPSCVDSTCAMVVAPFPPSFSWSSPVRAEVIPTNTHVTGSILAGSDPNERLRAFVAADGEERELEASSAHCAITGGCEDTYALGPLPANTPVTLTFLPTSPGQAVSWMTGDGPDVTAPTIGELTVENVGVSRDGNGRMFKTVVLGYVDPVDDSGIGNFGLVRSVDGSEPALVERIAAFQIGPQATDQFAEDSAAREACYSFLAWDWAGNEARSEPVCVDVTISEEEQRSIPSCAAVGHGASFLALLLALRRGRWRRRSRSTRQNRPEAAREARARYAGLPPAQSAGQVT